jgi:glucan biosynthesis protein C
MMTPPPASRRYHGLDAIRAVMMALGLLLHVALCYGEGPWIYKDPATTGIAGLITVSVHVFRMPIFFVMAGFFGAMIHERRGARVFAIQRFDRIVVPLAIGWFVLFPLLSWSIIFAWTHASIPPDSVGGGWNAIGWAFRKMAWTTNWADAGPMHLWFLYDLVWFYAAAIVLSPFVTRLGPITRGCRAALDGLTLGRARWLTTPLVLTILTLLMLSMKDPGLDTQDGWRPVPHLLLVYGLWFWLGWIAWPRRGVVDRLHAGWWWRLPLGLLLLTAATIAVIRCHVANGAGEPVGMVQRVITQVLVVASTWYLLLGLVGMAERLLRRENAAIRWFVDASYFLYLAHLPFAILVPAMLRNWDAPAFIKMTASLVIMTVGLSIAYQLLVRHSVIGVVLNGRRGRDHRPRETTDTVIPPTTGS